MPRGGYRVGTARRLPCPECLPVGIRIVPIVSPLPNRYTVSNPALQPDRIGGMALATEVYDAGQELVAATELTLDCVLNRVLRRFLGRPYRVTSASVVDEGGDRTERFASVIHVAPEGAVAAESTPIPVDTVAAVIDACESLDLDGFRRAYTRVAQAKALTKSAASRPEVPWSTNVTLGIILALGSDLPLDDVAEELVHLNAQTPSGEWPNVIAVASSGAISYMIQFPGDSSFDADFLLPSEGKLPGPVPPMYIAVVMRPTGAHTFNKMMACLTAHLAIFAPGAQVPKFTEILEGVPSKGMMISGYQYNLGGELLPVPRQFYNDRYLPPLPWRIEDTRGDLLSTLEFLPWQDGGVILLRGRLPLEGLLIFLGKQALGQAGLRTYSRPSAQLSSVLPITQQHFRELLGRIQRQTNMVVRREEPKMVWQKVSDEGSSSPVVARVLMGVMRLRDQIYLDDASREKFDKCYELVTSPVLNARTTAQKAVHLYEEHVRKVASGEIARLQGQTIRVDESINKELAREVEGFLNTAVRALKQGMQRVANELQVDIGFLFKQQAAFENGLAALRITDCALAEYLRQTRVWSERLVESRNAIEHEGWTLPRVTYSHTASGIEVREPSFSGQPVSQFVTFTLDRLLCFVEDVTVHCLQRQLPVEFTITEIPLAQRLAEVPRRFELTLARGGRPAWQIAYHSSTFEET